MPKSLGISIRVSVPDIRLLFTVDLFGAFRTELVLTDIDKDNRPTVFVVTAKEVNKEMQVAPAEAIDYRLWLARNISGGYGSVYDPLYLKPGIQTVTIKVVAGKPVKISDSMFK